MNAGLKEYMTSVEPGTEQTPVYKEGELVVCRSRYGWRRGVVLKDVGMYDTPNDVQIFLLDIGRKVTVLYREIHLMPRGLDEIPQLVIISS